VSCRFNVVPSRFAAWLVGESVDWLIGLLECLDLSDRVEFVYCGSFSRVSGAPSSINAAKPKSGRATVYTYVFRSVFHHPLGRKQRAARTIQ
jgi:hypothetical protein